MSDDYQQSYESLLEHVKLIEDNLHHERERAEHAIAQLAEYEERASRRAVDEETRATQTEEEGEDARVNSQSSSGTQTEGVPEKAAMGYEELMVADEEDTVGQLEHEKRMRRRAESMIQFMKLECEFRRCSCRLAEAADADANAAVAPDQRHSQNHLQIQHMTEVDGLRSSTGSRSACFPCPVLNASLEKCNDMLSFRYRVIRTCTTGSRVTNPIAS